MAMPVATFFSVCLVACSLWVDAEPVTYFYSHLPPYESANAEGVPVGIGIDQVRKALQTAGFKPDFKFFSVSRGLNALHSNIDFTAVVSPSDLQKQQFRISQFPIYQVGIGVVRLASTPAMTSLLQLNDAHYLALSETKFAYLSQRSELTQLATFRYEVPTLQDAFRLILNSKYAYFLSYTLTDAEFTNPSLTFDLLEQQPVHLMLSKQHPDATRLMQRVDAALAAQQKEILHIK